MTRHSIILSVALLLSASLPAYGQYAYTYNGTGACTSRTKTASPSKARAVQPTSSAKITVIDFPTFGNTLTIKADSIGSGLTPPCFLSDVDGVSFATSPVVDGNNTFDTSALKSGIYFIKVYGLEQPFSCKVTKQQRP